ncbi:MAG: beta-lactamase family protein [Myxococcales bacterium]|nr:beta-lactamase family protein [Myxococcales bacterium]
MDEEIAAALEGVVDAGGLAGAATLVWRDGAVVHRGAVGFRNVEAAAPLAPDDLFRIASMTKPLTSTVALMLLEEGRFELDDAITRVAPELAEMRVLVAPTAPLGETVPAERPITFGDLLTHRSGLTYGDFWPGPLAEAYAAALGGDIDSAVAPDDWVSALATLPLIAQPGTAFHYGRSTDLLGLLVARIEDAPLGDVLARRVTGPLGMEDTFFTVPREKRARRAATYGFDADGRRIERRTGPGGSFVPERPDDMAYESGGQGLWSTVDDYLTFARMFVGAGAVDGVRLLRPETVARMTANQLGERQRAAAQLLGMPLFGEGHGFGLGVAVVLDPEQAAPSLCRGGVGTVGWPGAFGGWWQADPTDRSVMIFLAHNLVEPAQLHEGVGLGVYGAISSFHALASAR